MIKSLIRGHNPNITIYNPHYLNKKLCICDGFGNKIKNNGISTINPDFEYYYIKHNYSKSTEEFIDKIMKTDIYFPFTEDTIKNKIKRYFIINEITKEKLDYIKKKKN